MFTDTRQTTLNRLPKQSERERESLFNARPAGYLTALKTAPFRTVFACPIGDKRWLSAVG